MKHKSDQLSASLIQQSLSQLKTRLCLHLIEETDSTNNELKRMAAQGVKEDLLLIADRQTNGRGTMGRSFYSPGQTGIYLSLLLHPQAEVSQCLKLTTLSAAAAAKALEAFTLEPVQIKWVNDLYLHHRKVCGILTEIPGIKENGIVDGIIVGIGINVYDPDEGFPPDAGIAGAVFPASSRQSDLRSQIIAQLLTFFDTYYSSFPEDHFYSEYKQRCCVIGKQVRLLSPDSSSRTGHLPCNVITVLDIDKNYRLVARMENGEIRTFSNHEIRIQLS